jgi:hypothetical protein
VKSLFAKRALIRYDLAFDVRQVAQAFAQQRERRIGSRQVREPADPGRAAALRQHAAGPPRTRRSAARGS